MDLWLSRAWPDRRLASKGRQVVQQRYWFLIETLADKYFAPIFKCLRVNARLLTPDPSINAFSNVPSKPSASIYQSLIYCPRQLDSLKIRLSPGHPYTSKQPCKVYSPITCQCTGLKCHSAFTFEYSLCYKPRFNRESKSINFFPF